MVLAGLRMLRRAPVRGATLVSLGAVVGALPIFWALLPLLLAVALIVLSVLYARRGGTRELEAGGLNYNGPHQDASDHHDDDHEDDDHQGSIR